MGSCSYCTAPRCWRLDPPKSFREVQARFPPDPIIPFRFEKAVDVLLAREFPSGPDRSSALLHLRSIAAESVAFTRAMRDPRTKAELSEHRRHNNLAQERTDKQLQRLRGDARKLIAGLGPSSLLSDCVSHAGLCRVELVQMLRDLEAATMSERGAPVRDRTFELNIAVVARHFGVALRPTTSYARILNTMYDAIEQDAPKDGQYGISRVIHQVTTGEPWRSNAPPDSATGGG